MTHKSGCAKIIDAYGVKGRTKAVARNNCATAFIRDPFNQMKIPKNSKKKFDPFLCPTHFCPDPLRCHLGQELHSLKIDDTR